MAETTLNEPEVNLEAAIDHGMTEEEYGWMLQKLGRKPTYVELGIYSVMWSEHCSYKNSIALLKTLPREGGALLVAAGEENAGLVDIGDGLAVAFKIESHNHPSAVEPYQGAATGVGGIQRDIFTMGARPICSLNSLRFGPLENPRVRYLFDGVVRGIGDYGNSFGVPTVAGEVYFDESYEGNPLVNAMSVGVVRIGETASAVAKGKGNPVYIVGSATGRDGIHGATFASEEISEESEAKRPSVQVGDPFTEKLLLEATLEAIATGAVVGVQDMGAAGLTCSSCEMSARGESGMILHVDKVPVRELGMTPYEIMLSESQERMLIVCEKGREDELEAIFKKWDLNAAKIGEVTDDPRVRIYWHGELVADVEADHLVLGGGAPVYIRETRRPAYLDEIELDLASISDVAAGPQLDSNGQGRSDRTSQPQSSRAQTSQPQSSRAQTSQLPSSRAQTSEAQTSEAQTFEADTSRTQAPGLPNTASDVLLRLLGSPNIASKRWVFEQYDTMVRSNTVVGPGPSDAAVVRIKGTNRGLAVKTDCNGRYVFLDPRRGAQIAVAEAARNVVCAGGRPVAITNCLNFGNPYKPEVYWTFKEAVRGMGDACRAFDTPVTGGNVSFYNENPEGAVFPTPTIGMLGIVEDVQRDATTIPFRHVGDEIYLLSPAAWQHRDDINGSEYLARIHGLVKGGAPHIDLEEEVAVQTAMLQLIRAGIVQCAHDVSDGGLAVALAECILHGDLGATVEIEAPGYRRDAVLFGEAQSRIVFSVRTEDAVQMREILDDVQGVSVALTRLGTVTDGPLVIRLDGEAVVDLTSEALRTPYETAIPSYMDR